MKWGSTWPLIALLLDLAVFHHSHLKRNFKILCFLLLSLYMEILLFVSQVYSSEHIITGGVLPGYVFLLYRVIILSDQYYLSLSAILLNVWTTLPHVCWNSSRNLQMMSVTWNNNPVTVYLKGDKTIKLMKCVTSTLCIHGFKWHTGAIRLILHTPVWHVATFCVTLCVPFKHTASHFS
jgi:hypothetical protein